MGLRHKLELSANLYESALEKNLSNQEIISILKNEIKEAHERNDSLEKKFNTLIKLNNIKSIPNPGESHTIEPADDDEQPKVVIFHDSLCKKINPTILSKEKVTTKKIWAPTLDDVQKELTQIQKSDAIVLQPLTRSLNTPTEDIINQTTETIEMCLEKADKVIISTIISRDDDPTMNAKADLVNANLKFKYLNNPKIFICNNDNLRDKKFRVEDGIHLNDHGTSVFASNLKYKIAEALEVTVVKKSRYGTRPGKYRYTGYRRDNSRNNYDYAYYK